MTTLPDPKASRALLVGVSQYLHMAEDRQLPSVKNNLDRLATALSSEWVWSLPVGHCTVLHQPHDAETVIQALRATADAATDTALFYFAGHGLTDPTIGTGLYLGLPGSYEPHGTHTALGYEYVRSKMRRCRALRKVIVLDCCWSGKAATGLMGGESLATAVEGTAVLTATAATRPALAPPEAPLTSFTGVLLEILEQGIANAPGLLTVEHVFTELRERLRARDFPEPQFTRSSCGASIVLAQNVRAQGKVGEANLQDLRRTGRYDEAQRRLLLNAAQGDPYSIREVALQLRRTGDYAIADELERAAMSGHVPLHEFVFGRLLSN